MSNTKQITTEDFKEWVEEKEVNYAQCIGGLQRLYLNATLNGKYRVYKNDTLILETENADDAVKTYKSYI